ncbi:Phosphatase dcr2 [Lecanora helva]
MTRRIVRTTTQLGTLTLIIFVLVFFLDNRFNVLPDAIHNALPVHQPGLVITDISVATCSTLNILSSCRLDPEKWHRIEKDLYLSRGWLTHAFVHIERKQESELIEKDRVILDVRTGSLDPVVSEKNQAAERWESRPGGIWLKRTAKHRESDNVNAITAVDVLFGSDAVEPRPGWELGSQPLLLPNAGPENQETYLSIRRGHPKVKDTPTLHVNKDGKFKVIQVADLHLSTGPGICRDPEPALSDGGKCDADPRTLAFISSVLDSEKPDLVVLSGDQVNGETAPDAQSAVFKFARLFIDRKIPFATIFGNHDDEGSLSREALMQLTHDLPYSLSEYGPTNIDGVGNYYIEVLGRGGSSHSALTLYLLDTHGYSPDERQFRGYDWIKKNQIDWFKTTSSKLRKSPSHTGYTHHHMDMAFIHIPIPEYRLTNDIVASTGSQPESPTAPGFNSGFRDALVEEGVLAVSCGHDHVNDYCSLSKSADDKPQLWMCYAGGSGFGGYGGYGGYHRRVRVFEYDMNEARIITWKRLEHGDTEKQLDRTVIVESGKVVAA